MRTSRGDNKIRIIWGLLRMGLGLIFLWAFFDKLLGLGFSTCRDGETGIVTIMCEGAWLNGGSPTTGFLKFATSGPLAGFYQSLAGITMVDWIFMLGLLGIGIGLTFGIMVRISSLTGALIVFMMWSAVLPPEHHPFLDDHIIYLIVLVGFIFSNAGRNIGFGEKWEKLNIVRKYKFLR
jgi:thiosulfate dehydrogenase (quinone) large subunit